MRSCALSRPEGAATATAGTAAPCARERPKGAIAHNVPEYEMFGTGIIWSEATHQ